MKKQWVEKQLNTDQIPNLPEYSPLVVKLLALRNLTSPEAITDFLNPDFGKLENPFLFKDMQKAIDRIWQAIENKEKIVIYADYDADAITACAVCILALKKLGAEADYYIPDRFTEGYGVNADAIRKIAQEGGELIITVDCGTNSVEEAKLAKELGMDFIVTDHHEVTGDLPDAFALINPKNPQDSYPFQYLTGVGVAFKLMQALFSTVISKHLSVNIPEGWEKWLLDLVAIGTVADCQSLSGENRILVNFGLKVLPKSRWAGVRAILENSGSQNRTLDTFTLGFIIAPRINAAGRLKHASVALRALIAENILEAQNLAIELNDLNKHRQLLTEQILSEARAQVELSTDKKILLAAGSNWPKGVVGLVAGKLTEEFGRPVLVLEKGEIVATGSARSVPGFNIVAALGFAKDLLDRYGGHDQAAGFTLQNDNIGLLHQKLLEFADTLDTPPQKALKFDAKVTELDLNWENFDLIAKFGSFGIDNPRPRFVSENMTITDMRIVGNGSKHLKLTLNLGERFFSAIYFGGGFMGNILKIGDRVDVLYELDANEWNGTKELQLKVVDIKPAAIPS